MPALPLTVVLFTLLSAGCASTSAPTPPSPLPDARQLAEDPLDVVNLPQP